MVSKWPRVAAQALRVRRSVQRLPESVGRVGHHGVGAAARRVVVIGDSVAAGVGVARGDDTVAGCLARLLARPGAAASWAIHARGGLDARGVTALLDRSPVTDDLMVADLVLLSVGVNDLTGGRSTAAWRSDLATLLDRLGTVASDADVVLLGLPPVATFPALPALLRDALGARAARLDVVGADVARTYGVRHLPLDAGLLRSEDAFAEDGFHPSASSHALLAGSVLALLDETMRGEADAVR